jgi:hypothetical protein
MRSQIIGDGHTATLAQRARAINQQGNPPFASEIPRCQEFRDKYQIRIELIAHPLHGKI